MGRVRCKFICTQYTRLPLSFVWLVATGKRVSLIFPGLSRKVGSAGCAVQSKSVLAVRKGTKWVGCGANLHAVYTASSEHRVVVVAADSLLRNREI